MKIISLTLLALTLAASMTIGSAADTSSDSAEEQVNVNVRVLAAAQRRNFTHAATFCTTTGRPLELRLDEYIDAFSAGTKAGMLEIAKTEPAILSPMPIHSKADIEMIDKQADNLLRTVQSNPDIGCKKLADILGSKTVAAFKESTLQSHRDYTAKREKYCATTPKPKSCQ